MLMNVVYFLLTVLAVFMFLAACELRDRELRDTWRLHDLTDDGRPVKARRAKVGPKAQNSSNSIVEGLDDEENFFKKSSKNVSEAPGEPAEEGVGLAEERAAPKYVTKIQKKGFNPATSYGIRLTPFEAEYRLIEATHMTISKGEGSSYNFRTGTETSLHQTGVVESSRELNSVFEKLLESNSWKR